MNNHLHSLEMDMAEINMIPETCSANHFIKLETFHPEGRSVPNSVHVHRGFYYCECNRNQNSFILNNQSHNYQKDLGKYKGGVILFPVSDSTIITKHTISYMIENFMTILKVRCIKRPLISLLLWNNRKFIDETTLHFDIGNCFYGKYSSTDGSRYNSDSLTVEVSGLTHKGILLLADFLRQSINCESIVVYDFNKRRFYIGSSTDLGKNK